MGKVISLKDGRQVFTSRYGIPIQTLAKPLLAAMADIADQVDYGDYIEIDDGKTGYIELHFYDKEDL